MIKISSFFILVFLIISLSINTVEADPYDYDERIWSDSFVNETYVSDYNGMNFSVGNFSGENGTNGVLFFEDFESGTVQSYWTKYDTRWTVTNGLSMYGTYSGGLGYVSGALENIVLLAPDSLDYGAEVINISFWMSGHCDNSRGGGIEIYDSDGNTVTCIANDDYGTNDDWWDYENLTGWHHAGGTYHYDYACGGTDPAWYHHLLSFNWTNGTFDWDIYSNQGGHWNYAGLELQNATNISYLVIKAYQTIGTGWVAGPYKQYYDNIQVTAQIHNMTSIEITKPENTFWTNFSANCTGGTFSILDSDGTVLLSNLDGNNSDITSISESTIKLFGNFYFDDIIYDWNVTWEVGLANFTFETDNDNCIAWYNDTSHLYTYTIDWYNWNLGDGTTSYYRNITHTYDIDWENLTDNQIVFPVKLEVENESTGAKASETKNVTFYRPEEDEGYVINLEPEFFVGVVGFLILIVMIKLILNISEGWTKKFRR